MKYYYNQDYGLILYPNNWFDVIRLFFTWILHPSFKRTWKGNPYWYKSNVVGCIEKELIETQYPNEVTGG